MRDNDTKITSEMARAGTDCLEEYVNPGGLENSADYVAKAVYRAMERQRLETLAEGALHIRPEEVTFLAPSVEPKPPMKWPSNRVR